MTPATLTVRQGSFLLRCVTTDKGVAVLLNKFNYMFSARSERYHHLASDEDEETNDEESSLEIRQFASWSHRFSKVKV